VSASISTVVNVAWQTSTPTIGYVAFGTTPSLELSTPLEQTPSTAHHQALLGLKPGTAYYYRVLTWDVTHVTAGASEVLTFQTGALPAEAPAITVQSFPVNGDDGKPEDPMEDFVLAPFVGPASTTLGMVDPSGALIWYYVEKSTRTVMRARLSRDKASVFYDASSAGGTDAEIVRVPLDGTATSSTKVPGPVRDFVELADGTLAVLVPSAHDANGTAVTGDVIVEVARDGTQKTAFHTWDCFDPVAAPGDGTGGVWSGASALQIDSKRDAYFVALRNLNAVVKVDRPTATCTWIAGSAPNATLAFAAGTAPFTHPGSFQASDAGLVLVDAGAAGASSQLVDYLLDQTAKTATQAQRYTPATAAHVTALGEATRLVGDDKLVNFGNEARMEVVDPKNQLKWSLRVTSGQTLGYHTAFRDLYQRTVEGNQ
jgi:hypothetical protein